VGEWYRETAKDVLSGLKVSQKTGLSAAEVKTRQKQYGLNQLEAGKKLNPLKLFFGQFNDVLVIILLLAACVSLALEIFEGQGKYTESILIFAIVLAIAAIGFFNEYKAEKTVEALKKLVGHNAKVRRDGRISEIPSGELVPGDIVLLDEGQKIPADIRLLTVRSLQVNESSLTGESLPVSKNTFPINSTAALGDQKCMVFSGTIINTGTAEGVVTTTGQGTEIGKIAHMVNEVGDELTPMQKKLDDLGRKMGILVLLICILVFIVIFFGSTEAIDKDTAERLVFAFTVAVALAVAAIPEGLSFVVRISLALGARRMADKNALVRKLSAVEALGSTDVICTDKTGTLTKGEMTVRKIFTNGKIFEVDGSGYGIEGSFSQAGKKLANIKELIPILRAAALNNNSHIKEGAVIGDPTEAALLVSAAKAGLDRDALNQQFPRVDEVPFSSERKLMSTVNRMEGRYVVLTKGAPDVLLNRCDRALINGRIKKLDEQTRKKIMDVNKTFARDALRVLAVAYKESTAKPSGDKDIESKLVFLGLQGMMDPPREEVKLAMHTIHAEAGMRVLMITGDYIETAKAVAKEIGIHGRAITGEDLDKLSQAEFEKQVEKISVYARVNPEHKIRIVQALKKHGHQVAMTGDGVNDAPAIKAADIGIAMGITGTDASKEAADLILLDDQFLTIINAIEEGRGIFDNVRKFVSYLLGANIVEVMLVVGGIIFLKNPILTATQLLFINIVTDGLPAIALGSDPAEKGIMRFKPVHFQDAIINKQVWIEMIVYGITATTLLLWQFSYLLDHHGATAAVSAAFTGLVVYELVRLVALRTNYNIPWFSNPWLTVALVASFLIQLAVMYVPFLAELFGVAPISATSWEEIIIGSVIIFVVMKLTRKILTKIMTRVEPGVHKVAHA
jgi:Ca2+-transporting ATPase